MKTAIGPAIFAALLCGNAYGADVVVHGLSKHGRSTRSDGLAYVERNVGIGLRHDSLQAGVYRNSWGRMSAYVLLDWFPISTSGVDAGVFVGAAVGYPFAPVLPVVGLSARIGVGRSAVIVRAVPQVGGRMAGVVAVELSWGLR